MVLFFIIMGMDQAFIKATPKQTVQVQRNLDLTPSDRSYSMLVVLVLACVLV
jgi:hypothetical protein